MFVDVFFYICVVMFGLIIGSFLNYIIYRLSIENYSFMKNVVGQKSRSYCPKCGHRLRWQDLFPVASFLFLFGKCRYCHKNISMQYPLVELATALLFFFIVYVTWTLHSFPITYLLFLFYIVSVFIILFVYDFQHYIIPDKILLPTIVITFVYQLIFNPLFLLSNSLWAGLSIGLFFTLLFLVSKGTWIGFGDCKLAILLGILLGFPNIFIGMFLSFMLGAIVGMGAILFEKKGLKSEIPFAPFLITGTFIAMFFGTNILQWYLSFIVF